MMILIKKRPDPSSPLNSSLPSPNTLALLTTTCLPACPLVQLDFPWQSKYSENKWMTLQKDTAIILIQLANAQNCCPIMGNILNVIIVMAGNKCVVRSPVWYYWSFLTLHCNGTMKMGDTLWEGTSIIQFSWLLPGNIIVAMAGKKCVLECVAQRLLMKWKDCGLWNLEKKKYHKDKICETAILLFLFYFNEILLLNELAS